MTPEQREQVVELLRCAADCEFSDGLTFLRWAAIQLDVPWSVEHAAWLAFQYTAGDGTSRGIQLEAAARVEEGSWP